MKKLFTALLLVMALTSMLPGDNAYAGLQGKSGDVVIAVNGQRIATDVTPFIYNERTVVPLRGVFEKLGAEVNWIADQRTVIVKYQNTEIRIQIGNTSAYVNGSEKFLDVPPIIYNDLTMIPLRFISENIGMWVQWVPEAKLATITDPSYFSTLQTEKNTVLGFTTNDYKGDTGSYNSVITYSDNIDYIATFSYQVSSNGGLKLTGESQKSTVDFSNSNNIKPLVLIHNFVNGQFDKDVAHSILSDKTKREKLINNILVTMSTEQYCGVNIDIENIYWYDRQNYTSFVKELKEKLTPYGFLTTLSVAAKTYDSYINDNWGGAFDYPELGKYADKILIMTYDEHYSSGSAGSIASLQWVDSVMKYATSSIPSNKVLLGIPAYGYDWSSARTKVVTYKNVDKLISDTNAQSFWNESLASPWLSYTKGGITHEVWYENSQSISRKLNLVSKYNLGGIGIWRLGYDNDSFWNPIEEKLN